VIGGALTIAMFGGARGIPSIREWRNQARADAVANLAELTKAREIVRTESLARDSAIARGKRIIALARLVLSGDTRASAGASLAGIISEAATSSSVELGALELQPDSLSKSTFTRIAVRGSANGDIQGLTHMLERIEEGPELLAIKELSITQSDVSAGADHMEALHMELVVHGLMLTSAPLKRTQ
jgi:type II secretion system (T2SS) protein M